MTRDKDQPNGKSYTPAASGGGWDVHALRTDFGTSRKPVEVMIHERKTPDNRARLAMQCIERWAMVAGEVDGEDSAGRSKLRRMTAEELVGHACDAAERAFSEFEKRGWLIEVPSYPDLVDSVKDRENGND